MDNKSMYNHNKSNAWIDILGFKWTYLRKPIANKYD